LVNFENVICLIYHKSVLFVLFYLVIVYEQWPTRHSWIYYMDCWIV